MVSILIQIEVNETGIMVDMIPQLETGLPHEQKAAELFIVPMKVLLAKILSQPGASVQFYSEGKDADPALAEQIVLGIKKRFREGK